MKKVLITLMGAIALLGALSSCQKTTKSDKLSTPSGFKVVDFTSNSITISWDAVENATSYEYAVDAGTIDQFTGNVSENTVKLEIKTDVSHTLMVKAVNGDNLYKDSEYGHYTIESKKIPFDATIEITAVTSSTMAPTVTVSDENHYYYMSIYPAEYFDQYTEKTMIEEIEYIIRYYGGVQQCCQKGSKEYEPATGLAPSTEYVVYLAGVDVAGKVDSEIFSARATTDAYEGPTPEAQSWFGYYSVTFEKTLRWFSDGQSLKYEVLDTPFDCEIYVEDYNMAPEQVCVFGLSHIDEDGFALPAVGVVEDGKLNLMSGITVMDDPSGYLPTWACFVSTNGQYTMMKDYMPAYTLNKETGIATPAEGTVQGGNSFKVINFGIYGINGNSVSVYYDTEAGESFLPAGNATFTTSSAQSVNYKGLWNKNYRFSAKSMKADFSLIIK